MWEVPALTVSGRHFWNCPRDLGWTDVEHGFPCHNDERVEEDDASHAVMDLFHGAQSDSSAVAVGDQDRILDILELENLYEILDVRAEPDFGTQKVRALAESGQGRRVDLVASVAEKRGHTAPAPATVASAVEECKGGQICH